MKDIGYSLTATLTEVQVKELVKQAIEKQTGRSVLTIITRKKENGQQAFGTGFDGYDVELGNPIQTGYAALR